MDIYAVIEIKREYENAEVELLYVGEDQDVAFGFELDGVDSDNPSNRGEEETLELTIWSNGMVAEKHTKSSNEWEVGASWVKEYNHLEELREEEEKLQEELKLTQSKINDILD